MKRRAAYAALSALAIVGGIALARVGAPSVASADSGLVPRTRIPWAGLTACASVGGHDTPDPEPSVAPSVQAAAPVHQNTEANKETDEAASNDRVSSGPSASVDQALAEIRGNVDVPVVLPDGRPRDV